MIINPNTLNMITTKQSYLAPEIQELELNAENNLCVSTVGAGVLDDNSWDLQFGEDNK